MSFKKFSTVVIVLLGLFVTSLAMAVKPVYVGGKERAAIRGYDPVAYFTENKAVKGSPDFSFEYQGATWLFSNEQHRTAFSADPEKYSPQYGGYCAYAVASGRTASIKPEFFTIEDGKLYLNYSRYVYKKWTKDKASYIDSANEKWPELMDKK